MNLDDYFSEWKKDAPIPPDELDASARNVPTLHAKWYKFLSAERLRYKKLDIESKTLHNQKYQWYSGKMVDEDRVKLGWPINPLKIMSAAMGRTLEADPQVQQLDAQKAMAEETCRFLEDVIKQINGRGYYISTAVNFLKFKMGV